MSAKIKKKDALDYHEFPTPGKIQVHPTKKYSTQRDLSLAYSPGVAEPCLEIAENELDVYRYTSKGNLVAVISNGTAVLGLGDIGPSASKPVMEGKALLFKIFADIDVFDIEVDASDVDKFVETVKAISPTFEASTWKTSRPRKPSRSSGDSRRSSIFLSCTMTSTARRSFRQPL